MSLLRCSAHIAEVLAYLLVVGRRSRRRHNYPRSTRRGEKKWKLHTFKFL